MMGKSLYRPGHDARHTGQVARYVAESGDETRIQILPTDALRTKAENMVLRLGTKAQVQADRAEAKLADNNSKARFAGTRDSERTGSLQRNEYTKGTGTRVAYEGREGARLPLPSR